MLTILFLFHALLMIVLAIQRLLDVFGNNVTHFHAVRPKLLLQHIYCIIPVLQVVVDGLHQVRQFLRHGHDDGARL